MHKVESMKSTRCAIHTSYAWDLRPALYQGLRATAARLGQRGWLTERVTTTALARASPRSASTCWDLGGLSAPKNKVAFLETSGANFAAIEAAQSLLEASSSHSGLKTTPPKGAAALAQARGGPGPEAGRIRVREEDCLRSPGLERGKMSVHT